VAIKIRESRFLPPVLIAAYASHRSRRVGRRWCSSGGRTARLQRDRSEAELISDAPLGKSLRGGVGAVVRRLCPFNRPSARSARASWSPYLDRRWCVALSLALSYPTAAPNSPARRSRQEGSVSTSHRGALPRRGHRGSGCNPYDRGPLGRRVPSRPQCPLGNQSPYLPSLAVGRSIGGS
jgi:hypothetical protein